jgi:hypothetical protein
VNQWKSGRRPPRLIPNAMRKFRDDMKKFFDDAATRQQNKKLVNRKNVAVAASTNNKDASPSSNVLTASPLPENLKSPLPENLKSFLSKVLASPDLDNCSFFEVDATLLESMWLQACNETCELERRKEKKEQEAVSAAVQVQFFEEKVEPHEYPILFAKNIGLSSDEDITPVLREIVKLSKRIKSADVLKVLHCNDSTTSLVEIPCSAKQSGFKERARRSGWVHRVLESVRQHKKEDLLVDDRNDNDDDEIACTNDDAARWLITYLGDFFPKEFVKSAQASHMPVHQGKMNAEHTATMWSDAGVGVATQRNASQ